MLITAHGNSLRALVKHLDRIGNDEIVELNIPTGIPLVYELDDALKPIRHYYLGDPEAAKKSVNAALDAAGGKSLSPEVLDRAWSELTVTYDPIASALKTSAENGVKAGTTAEKVDLKGIYDLRQLNKILGEQHLEAVSAGGLGDQ